MAAIGGFLYTLRASHSDFPPRSGISELNQGIGINGGAIEKVALSGFVSVIRSLYCDSMPQSSPALVFLDY